jgi:hypothetical protein
MPFGMVYTLAAKVAQSGKFYAKRNAVPNVSITANAGTPHFAKDCKWLHDVCGGCGGNHRLIECLADLSTGSFCINCNTPGHTVWDRNCEAFKFHCDKLSAIFKDHQYPYFVTEDISTWESTMVAPILQGQARAPNDDGWITVNCRRPNGNGVRQPE